MDVDSGTVKLVSVSLCSSQEGGGDDGVGTLGARVGEIVFFNVLVRDGPVKVFYSSVVDVPGCLGWFLDDTNAICSE